MYGKRPLLCFGSSTTRTAAIATLMLALGMLSKPILVRGTASGIDFQILDGATGLSVPSAKIKWGQIGQSSISPLSQSSLSSSEGKVPLQLSPGEYAFEISAPAYKSARTYNSVVLGLAFRANIVLDPMVQPEELRESTVAGKLRKGMELDHGFVADAVTHRPIAHVDVKLQLSGAAATTNSRGYFELMAPAQDTSRLRDAKEFPPADTLTASAPGYKTYIVSGLWHDPQSWRVINIELSPGTGVTNEDITPGALSPRSSASKNGSALEKSGVMPSSSAPENRPAASSSPIPRFLLRWLSGSATTEPMYNLQQALLVRNGVDPVSWASWLSFTFPTPPLSTKPGQLHKIF